MRNGRPGVFLRDRHFLTILLIPSDRRVDRPVFVIDHAVHQRVILPAGSLFRQLLRQRLMRVVILAGDDQPAGILVNPMHDPWPQHTVDPRKIMAVPKQTVDQRMIRIAWSRMHD